MYRQASRQVCAPWVVRELSAAIWMAKAGFWAKNRGTGARRIREPLPAELASGRPQNGCRVRSKRCSAATVVVPVGGGGLIGGIAVALRSARPGIRIVGAEPALADDAAESFRTGRVAPQRPPVTIADGKRTVLAVGEPEITQAGPEILLASAPVLPSGRFEIRCRPGSMTFQLSTDPASPWGLEFSWDPSRPVPDMMPGPGGLAFRHNRFAYDLACPGATITGRPEDACLLVTTGRPAISLVTGREP